MLNTLITYSIQSMGLIPLLAFIFLLGIAIIIASRMGFDHKIPFGPYLAGAGLVALLCGQQITAFIYGVTG